MELNFGPAPVHPRRAAPEAQGGRRAHPSTATLSSSYSPSRAPRSSSSSTPFFQNVPTHRPHGLRRGGDQHNLAYLGAVGSSWVSWCRHRARYIRTIRGVIRAASRKIRARPSPAALPAEGPGCGGVAGKGARPLTVIVAQLAMGRRPGRRSVLSSWLPLIVAVLVADDCRLRCRRVVGQDAIVVDRQRAAAFVVDPPTSVGGVVGQGAIADRQRAVVVDASAIEATACPAAVAGRYYGTGCCR